MGNFKIEQNRIIFEQRGEVVYLEPYGADCIRFRSSANLRIDEQDWTLLPPADCKCDVYIDGAKAVIKNGNLTAEINSWGYVVYYKNGHKLLSDEVYRYRPRAYRHVGGGRFDIRAYFKAEKGEHFYGLGQEHNDCFDLKGTSMDLFHINTKSTVPFVYSSRGYGFIWNNPAIGRVELAENRTLWQVYEAKQIDYIVVAGDKPDSIMRKYADITGYAPNMPYWATGFWQCKLRYSTQDELLSVAREYKRRNIPISVIVVDFFHWTEQGEWKFDPKFWPDPAAMVNELDRMGIKLIVSIWPTINEKSENYHEMCERNYTLKAERGNDALFNFHGQQTYVDFTNPDAGKYMWSIVKKNYFDNGVKAFWLDQSEPEILPNHYDNVRMKMGNGQEVGMLYPYLYTKALYDGLKSEGVDDVCLLVRAAWLGSQRIGTLLWSGDIPSTFESLRKQVKVGLNVAMSGIPWWNTDIGGFHGGNPDNEIFRELLVRWFQFGVFCPVTRLHGDREWTDRPDMNHLLQPSSAPNEIWSFGERNYDILKSLVELRERLRPYISVNMEKASKTGTPVMRPMFYDFYEQEECYGLDDQYMFGDDILFAPIVNEGQTKRTVCLPGGVTWVNVIDKKIYEGGQTIECSASIDEFIAFVRQDAEVLEVFE